MTTHENSELQDGDGAEEGALIDPGMDDSTVAAAAAPTSGAPAENGDASDGRGVKAGGDLDSAPHGQGKPGGSGDGEGDDGEFAVPDPDIDADTESDGTVPGSGRASRAGWAHERGTPSLADYRQRDEKDVDFTVVLDDLRGKHRGTRAI